MRGHPQWAAAPSERYINPNARHRVKVIWPCIDCGAVRVSYQPRRRCMTCYRAWDGIENRGTISEWQVAPDGTRSRVKIG